jgi:predicted metal-dependent peptidase
MTVEILSKAQEFLRRARLKLSGNKYRFLGLCLYSIRTAIFGKELPGMGNYEGFVKYEKGSSGTYENKIYINGSIIEKAPIYKTSNMIDIMLHEFNHILRRHDIRKGTRESTEWNIACDHIIDKSLKALNLSIPLVGYNILKQIEYDSKYTSEESVYNWLMANKNKPNKIQICMNPDGSAFVHDKWNNTEFTMFPDLASCIPGENGETPSDISPEQVQAIESYVSQVRAIYNMEKERGNISGGLQQAFEKLLEVHIPWEQVLEKAIKKCAFEKTDRRNWKRPNKFFINYGIYLPGRVPYTENNGVGTLIIHIDSSGSISDIDLRKAGYVIYKSIQHFNKIIVLVADVQIHQTVEFQKNNSEEMLKYFKDNGVKGRGGTSHKYVFNYFDKYLEENPDELSLCISITDMCSDIEHCLTTNLFHKTVPLIFLSSDGIKIDKGNVSTILIN